MIPERYTCYVGIQIYSHFILTTCYGVPDLSDFWPTPESALPNQVTETEGADRRTLLLLQAGARERFAFVVAEEREQ